MTNIEIATWALVFLTAVLALSTIAYTCVSFKLYKGSEHQTNAIKELSKSILQIPIIADSIQTKKDIQEELNIERKKIKTAQQKATTGSN